MPPRDFVPGRNPCGAIIIFIVWSASEFYNTAAADPEISIVRLGPATRGSDSRPELYSATTADPEIRIVSSSPATRRSYSRPDLYCTATAHTKCRVISCSSTSSANKSTLPAFCCHVIKWRIKQKRLKSQAIQKRQENAYSRKEVEEEFCTSIVLVMVR